MTKETREKVMDIIFIWCISLLAIATSVMAIMFIRGMIIYSI